MQYRELPSSVFQFAQNSIKVVIAYNSAATGKRAEAIYDRLATRLGENFDFEQRLWRFDVLEDDRLRAEAARETADADIVIIATSEEDRLPKGVRDWLESSMLQHSGAAALVALLEHGSAPVQPYLEEVARRGGLDFFAQTTSDPEGVPLVLFKVEELDNKRLANN